jgi:hypothetical protein
MALGHFYMLPDGAVAKHFAGEAQKHSECLATRGLALNLDSNNLDSNIYDMRVNLIAYAHRRGLGPGAT